MAREAHVDGGLELDDACAQSGRHLLGEHEVAEDLELTLLLAPRSALALVVHRSEELAVGQPVRPRELCSVSALLVLVRRRDLRLPPGEVAGHGERCEPGLRLGEECAHLDDRSYRRQIGSITTVRGVSATACQDHPVELVLGPGRARSRAGADLPPLVAVRRPRRRAARAGRRFSQREQQTSPSSSCATRSGSCARSSTSAAIGARCCAKARGPGRPFSVPTTHGRTRSTEA